MLNDTRRCTVVGEHNPVARLNLTVRGPSCPASASAATDFDNLQGLYVAHLFGNFHEHTRSVYISAGHP